MSAKNRDDKNRWRSKTIAFRVSPEENQDLNTRVKLSGLTKQDYIIRRCQERDVVVVGNTRVYKALKDQMTEIYEKLLEIHAATDIDDMLLATIQIVSITLGGMKGGP